MSESVAACVSCLTVDVCVGPKCLSLQGMPLFVQIDTFDDLSSPEPETAHRCYCKIKTFRDKVSLFSLVMLFSCNMDDKNLLVNCLCESPMQHKFVGAVACAWLPVVLVF